jgi:hypothetical protein
VAPPARQAAPVGSPGSLPEPVRIEIQPGAYIEVYLRQDEHGRGPAASLHVAGVELLRLDCFGGDQGHLHLDLGGELSRRWYFPPGSVEDHCERAAFELGRNFAVALAASRHPAVRGAVLSRTKMERAAAAAREALLRVASTL